MDIRHAQLPMDDMIFFGRIQNDYMQFICKRYQEMSAFYMHNRARTRNLGNNRVVVKQRLRRGCAYAYAQPRLSLRFSRTQRK